MTTGTPGEPVQDGGAAARVAPAAREALRRRLAELVEAASDRQVSAAEAERAESLVLLGVSSLTRLRLIDAVEREFDVVLEVDEGPMVEDNLDRLALFLLDRAPARPGGPR